MSVAHGQPAASTHDRRHPRAQARAVIRCAAMSTVVKRFAAFLERSPETATASTTFAGSS